MGREGNGLVSIDEKVVAVGACDRSWMDADRLVFQLSPDYVLCIFDQRTQLTTQIQPPRGATRIEAGGGEWAAWLNGFGLYTSWGLHLPNAGLRAMGPDGELVYVRDYQSGKGLVIRRGNEDIWERPAQNGDGTDFVAFDVRAYGHGRVSWRNANGTVDSNFTLPVLMIPGEPVGGAIFLLIGSEWWIVYHDTKVLKARPIHSSIGILSGGRTPGEYHNHDAMLEADGFTILAGWSAGRGEQPKELRRVERDTRTFPRVDFAAPVTKPSVFDMRMWGFFGTLNQFPRNDGGSVYDYQPYGVDSYVVVKFTQPQSRTFFVEKDGAIWLEQDFTAPESVLKYGYAFTRGKWFPRQWDLTPFDVTDNEQLVFNADGSTQPPIHWPYRRSAEYLPSFDFGGDIGVRPCLKVARDSSPWTHNPRDIEWSYLTEAYGDTAWEDGHHPGVLVIWNRIGGQRVQPLPPLVIHDSTPDPKPDPIPEEPLAKRMKVSLQTLNGQYVVAEEGGGGPVNANREQRGPWEEFILTVLDDDVPPPKPPQPQPGPGPDPNPR